MDAPTINYKGMYALKSEAVTKKEQWKKRLHN